jgi:hypothetical protein
VEAIMFETLKRARAEARTAALMEALVRQMQQRLGDLPPHVWRDPYVVAYMQIVVASLLRSGTNGADGEKDVDFAIARVWRHATGQHPFYLLQQLSLPWSTRGPEAKQGLEDAALWLAFHARRPNFMNPRARDIFREAQNEECGDAMVAATAILFDSDIARRVGELVQAEAA